MARMALRRRIAVRGASLRREIFLGDRAGTLNEKGRELARRVAVLARVHPTEIRGAARREKQRQPLERIIGQRAFAAIAANERLARRRIDAVAGDEVKRSRKLE